MSSRMDKYEFETPELKRRTDKNADLYQNNEIDDYNKIDLNSNVSILKTNAQNIDVDKIREMLDKRYRDNIPRRKSIAIDYEEDYQLEKATTIDTKEYDINEILIKAKNNQNVDYHKERLKKINENNNNILEHLDLKTNNREHEKEELMSLINTITQLESQNKESARNAAADLLDLNATEKITPVEQQENTFYTGNLVVTDKDYEDFKEIQNDIKSNSILIKVLIIIFIISLIALAVFLLNKYLDLGLF